MHDTDPILKLVHFLQSISPINLVLELICSLQMIFLRNQVTRRPEMENFHGGHTILPLSAEQVTRGSKIENLDSDATLLTLPTEIRLQIFECYAKHLWPRLVSRKKDIKTPWWNKSSLLHRFSWCEGSELQVERRTHLYRKFFVDRNSNHPPEPGIFLSCKQIRRELIDVVACSRPFYFSRGRWTEVPWREYLLRRAPEGYTDRIHLLQDIEHHKSPCRYLNKWTTSFPALREVRLEAGRSKLKPNSCERIEWQLGSGRDWLEKRAQEAADAQLTNWYKQQNWLVPESQERSWSRRRPPKCRELPFDRQWRLVIETEFWLLARPSHGLSGKLKVEVVSSPASILIAVLTMN